MTNILSDNDYQLDAFNPFAIAQGIAERLQQRRLEHNLTQAALADRSGVSLGSLKRFEQHYEISLKNLLLLAVALDCTAEFTELFAGRHFTSIEELLKAKAAKTRKRGRGRSFENH
jgi:transcriptional regulator with XRE-family HTH domain